MLLTPGQIMRARDLIQLGPLVCIPELDLVLAEVDLAEPCRFRQDGQGGNETQGSRLAVMQNLVKEIARSRHDARFTSRNNIGKCYNGWQLVRATDIAKTRFYNSTGGVDGRWWKESGKTFAEYMQGELAPETETSVPSQEEIGTTHGQRI